ncbi:hypothetical protein, partial [Staphylococcus epidermidis]|uniref:hypothetical protein n=1 Tax=Staphylococcus epidermidis TaxID=1282 RepID=UPI001E518EC5
RMSVRGIDKAKRELGFVLMALNIRKVTAQRAENNQKNQNHPYERVVCSTAISLSYWPALKGH